MLQEAQVEKSLRKLCRSFFRHLKLIYLQQLVWSSSICLISFTSMIMHMCRDIMYDNYWFVDVSLQQISITFSISTYTYTCIYYMYIHSIYIICIFAYTVRCVCIYMFTIRLHHTIVFCFLLQICSEVQGFIVTVLGPCGQGTFGHVPEKRWSWETIRDNQVRYGFWDRSHI